MSVTVLAGLTRERVVDASFTAAPHFNVNLRHGFSTAPLPAGVSWHSSLTANQIAGTCDRQGVLKLTFAAPSRMRAEINMTFENSEGWTFNVGNSVTNNGWAGDSGTQDNDAEVHSHGTRISFYGRDFFGLVYTRANFVGVPAYPTLTLTIADELASANNGNDLIYINSHKLFALNGQSDSSPGGVNRVVYLGMNRVVGTAFRKGSGMCSVRVKFYP
ncbi:hypothetical protein ACOMHN_026605 [Nucella lapillus]